MAVIALFALQLMASPSPEQMYDSLDKDGKYRQMQEQLDQVIEKSEQAEKEKAAKQQIALWVALAIGFIPLCAIGKQVLSKRTWEENPSGTRQALGIALAGAVALFGLNYGIFLLKIEYGSSFNSVMAVALVLLLTIAAIYVVRKK
jgi:hypothetical protein